MWSFLFNLNAEQCCVGLFVLGKWEITDSCLVKPKCCSLLIQVIRSYRLPTPAKTTHPARALLLLAYLVDRVS
jgi:hypothetical protein